MPKYISAYFLRRPKFISVTVSGARFRECSTLSNWFNLYENCDNPVCAPCRRAEALGYGMQSPPARAVADYVFRDHIQKGVLAWMRANRLTMT